MESHRADSQNRKGHFSQSAAGLWKRRTYDRTSRRLPGKPVTGLPERVLTTPANIVKRIPSKPGKSKKISCAILWGALLSVPF